MKEEVRDIYWYIEKMATLQKMREHNPNNYTFGTIVRSYLEDIQKGKEPKIINAKQ
jgi:hypothetical protein